jgi:hypothetical protein
LFRLTRFDPLNLFLCRIPKKWKWTGKLLMDVTDKKDVASKTDHVCDVVLNELFPPTVNGGLHINNVMASAESIHLLSFHDLVDMHEFLKTSGVRMDSSAPLQQLARLGPSTEKDAEPLKILARYMTKKAFVRLATFPDYAWFDIFGGSAGQSCTRIRQWRPRWSSSAVSSGYGNSWPYVKGSGRDAQE